MHVLGLRGGVHGEPRGEHLRQHDEIGVPGETGEVPGEDAAVGSGVFPGEVRLDQRHAQVRVHEGRCSMLQILANRSPAASRVAASLAKQKRTSCSSGGGEENTETGIAATPCSMVSCRANSTSGSSDTAE